MNNFVLILDFGSQYTKLIARRIRELNIYSEIKPFNIQIKEIKELNPSAIILSGGPSSVYEKNSPSIKKELFELNIPVLGICYGFQLISKLFNGKIQPSHKKEYGYAKLKQIKNSPLLFDIKKNNQVWMSHGDKVISLPPGFKIIASTENTKHAAVENPNKKIYGVQFHPEVIHTEDGKKIIKNFCLKISNIKPSWNMKSFIEHSIKNLKEKIGNNKVILGLSGGVDSSVTALLLYKAIGKNLMPVFIDTGLLRKNEYKVLKDEFKHLNIKVYSIDASNVFFRNLKGAKDPEKKRKIIGETFIELFTEKAKSFGKIKFLAQGTTYPDVIESTSINGPSEVIKSHHNVGGLPKNMDVELIEPLKELFKDEVRKVGKILGLHENFIKRHPFPGPGLAVRIIDEITPERVKILQNADYIIREEIKNKGIYDELWQGFGILLPVKSVGVMGDKRTYENVCVIRMVTSQDGMTANWYYADSILLQRISTRIVNEVEGINRIVYDITSKPPATIEWE